MHRKTQVIVVTVVAIVAAGYLISLVPRGERIAPESFVFPPPAMRAPTQEPPAVLPPPQPLTVDPLVASADHAREAREAELRERFNQGVLMLHASEFEYAVKAFHRALELAPRLPEAHVNMGFALLGQKQFAPAADFFASAIELNAFQANAYYGLASALDELGDREAALGAMRSFVHLAGEAEEPYLPRARAALWEWQAGLEEEREGSGAPEPDGDPR